MIHALPERWIKVQKYCTSAQMPMYTGAPDDAVSFAGRLHNAIRMHGLAQALLPPTQRSVVVPEQVRLEENVMLHELLRAAYVRCPERFPLDEHPELSIDGSPRIARAWWLYEHLSKTSAILSAQDGHEALQRFTALKQGAGIHSLSVFINAMNDCRRILAVAPKAVVLTSYMLERQIKNGLNERCRVYARTIDFTEPIEHVFQDLTMQDAEWLQ